jgi:hypothetical protein
MSGTNVCFTPKSGHAAGPEECPLSAPESVSLICTNNRPVMEIAAVAHT